MTARFDQPHVGLVVEGAGDRNALPALLRRHMHDRGEFRDLLSKPVPANGREKALVAGGLESLVGVSSSRPGCRCVLVVLDTEGDPLEELTADLQGRAQTVARVPARVVLAQDDFEDWIYASAETLNIGMEYVGGRNGQSEIKRALKPASYVKPTWQPRLTERMDLQLAASRSVSLAELLETFDLMIAEHFS